MSFYSSTQGKLEHLITKDFVFLSADLEFAEVVQTKANGMKCREDYKSESILQPRGLSSKCRVY